MNRLRTVWISCLFLASGGCSSITYYGQSIAGQMALLRGQQPLVHVLEDPDVDAQLKQKLQMSRTILDYARTRLALPDNGSYEHYTDTGRQYVVWNVFAAPEFSLEPKHWCYLLIGCTSYRGYFRQQQALDHAKRLQGAGWEVSVRGVSAYSTLGWLRDPLLNTMFNRDSWETARLLFHELAHQLVYIPGDTDFNEAFADAVASIGLTGWLQEQQPELDESVRIALEREEHIITLVLAAREKFARLYTSGLAAREMREQKSQLHEQLRQDYLEMKQQWNGDNRYDHWMMTGINNASLAALSAYRSLVPAFIAAYRFHGGSLPRLYSWVENLARCSRAERLLHLQHPENTISCNN